MTTILALPAELTALIATFTPIEDLLTFALTCHQLHSHLKDILKLHARYHAKYRIQHDRVPSTIPSLLRLAIQNPDAAWHVRVLEIWGLRPNPTSWKSWPLARHEAPDEPHKDYSDHINDLFSSEELETWEQLIRDMIQPSPADAESDFWMADSDWSLDRWMEKLRQGDDQLMKFLLLALFPRLDHVQWIGHDYRIPNPRHWEYPLHFLAPAIYSILNHPTAPWPAGFASLRRIDLCPPSSDPETITSFDLEQDQIASLLLLPSLTVLNIRNAHGGIGEATNHHPPRGTSRIEELGVYDCDFGDNFWPWLLSRPTGLKKLCINSFGEQAEDEGGMIEMHRATMREIDVVGLEPKFLGKFPMLEICDSLCIDELIPPHPRTTIPSTVGVQVLDLRDYLPPTIKRLTLKLGDFGWTHNAEVLERLLLMLADFVEDPRYDDFHVLCLSDLVPTIDHELDKCRKTITCPELGDCEEHGGLWEAFGRVEESGVEMHGEAEGENGEERHRALHPPITGMGEILTDFAARS